MTCDLLDDARQSIRPDRSIPHATNFITLGVIQAQKNFTLIVYLSIEIMSQITKGQSQSGANRVFAENIPLRKYSEAIISCHDDVEPNNSSNTACRTSPQEFSNILLLVATEGRTSSATETH